MIVLELNTFKLLKFVKCLYICRAICQQIGCILMKNKYV